MPKTTSQVQGGAIDPASGKPCGWANGLLFCLVPGCQFNSSERCLLVKHERGEA